MQAAGLARNAPEQLDWFIIIHTFRAGHAAHLPVQENKKAETGIMKALICALLGFALAVIGGCGSSTKTFPQISLVYASGSGTNAVQGFSLKQNGELTALNVNSFSTNPRPVSMALTPSKNFVYVANDTSNTVSGFSLDHTSGLLTPVGTAVPPSPICPANVPCSTPISVGVSSDGQFLFVLNQGNPTAVPTAIPANISVFSVDARGLLTQVAGSPFAAPASPQFMVVSPNAAFIYVSAANTVVALPFSAGGAVGAPVSTFTSPSAGATIAGTTIDSKGFLYATDSTNNQLLVLSGQSTGTLTQVGAPVATGTKPVNVAANSTGTVVYVSNQGSNNISGFQANAGALTPVANSPFITAGSGATGSALLTAPGFLIFDASNTYLLVSNTGTKAIAVFLIDPATGSAFQVTDSPFGQTLSADWLISTI